MHTQSLFMPFYAYQSVLCLSANDQKWGILCLSACKHLLMIVGPKTPLLMLIRQAIDQLMLVKVWKKLQIDFSWNNVFFATVCPDRCFSPPKQTMYLLTLGRLGQKQSPLQCGWYFITPSRATCRLTIFLKRH